MKRKMVLTLAAALILCNSSPLWAQNEEDVLNSISVEQKTLAENEHTAAVTNTPVPKDTFMDVVKGSGTLGIILWIMIFMSSAAAICFTADGLLTVRKSKIIPHNLTPEVQAHLQNGNLEEALNSCKKSSSPLGRVLYAGLSNTAHGYESVSDTVLNGIELEEEKLMQRINYLNLCGAIAPMLGLLGTVTGMVDAFYVLGTSSGAEKAKLLAVAISQALYTTEVGLFISIPAILAFTLLRNHASKIIINLVDVSDDTIKIIRNAEIEE